MTDDCPVCNCQINGQILSPEAYMKVRGHKLRKSILHNLYLKAIDGPITKFELSEVVGIKYEAMNYQLNEHLSEYWDVAMREKTRGAFKEFISPTSFNTIYLNIGPQSVLYVVDPLANKIGTLADVGTRCDECSPKQQKNCSDELVGQDCLKISNKELKKREAVLAANNRKEPFTPVDYLLVHVVANSLERGECTVKFTSCQCRFIDTIKSKK